MVSAVARTAGYTGYKILVGMHTPTSCFAFVVVSEVPSTGDYWWQHARGWMSVLVFKACFV